MAAISFKTFTGPFTNKVHLVSLVLITALFGAYRWSGGGFSVQSTGAATAADVTTQAPKVAAVPANRAVPLAAPAQAAPVQAARPRVPAAAPAGGGTAKRSLSLDEIESQLGMKGN